MIITNKGVTIKFTRLDKWAIKIETWVDGNVEDIPLCTAILTIDDLISEVNLLQRSKPQKT